MQNFPLPTPTPQAKKKKPTKKKTTHTKTRIRKIQFPCMHDSFQREYQIFTTNLKYFQSMQYHT